ncbi:MAG: hypothetical protein IIW52_07025 [Alistipes sp.]|nr:hypothetical protein [Alistipes sp.]
MKRFFTILFIALAMCISTTSCEKNNEDNISDYASVIEGTYVGTIMIKEQNGLDWDTFKGAKLIVKRSSNEFAIVDFSFANDEKIFDEPSIYEIEKFGDLYMLNSDESTIEEIRILKGAASATGYVYTDTVLLTFSFEGNKQ